MNTTVIETRGLSKKFRIGTNERLTLFSTLRYKLSGDYPTRELWALRDINFSVDRGEMVAVIGPNGAGKSTLFRILAGIMVATSGSFAMHERVSCIFDLGLGFNPRFTALENVYLYGALHGLSRREVDRKLPDIVDFSGLEGFMGARLSEYSSGMRARLAFATIIQTVKGIVLIDEVLAVGDIAFRKKCTAAIQQVLNDGNTVLFIAHGMEEVKSFCSRALYIDGGKQAGYGKVSEMEDLYLYNTELKQKSNDRVI